MPSPKAEATPLAAHSICLGEGREVTYRLRRSRRRTIGLSIDHRGLTVGAPERARLGDIEGLIRKHGAWVLEKLDGWRDRAATPKLEIVDGMRLPCLGSELVVCLASGGNRAVWSADGRQLTLCLAVGASPATLLERVLRERVRGLFAERLAIFAPLLGVKAAGLALSSARTRWGSCSHRGGIRLNWRLVFVPLPVIDYVVVHELAHLKEMNHSPRFWSLVEQFCPDWRLLRRQLRQLGPTLPIL